MTLMSSRVLGSMLVAALVACSSQAHAQTQAPIAKPTSTGIDAAKIELHEVRADLASTTRLWPALTLSVGVAGLLTATSVGMVEAIACDKTCSASSWVGVVLVSSAAVSTAGLIWFLRVNHDIHQLELKRSLLEQEIDASHKHSALERRELALRTGPQITLRFAL